jgi:hypothetical protein
MVLLSAVDLTEVQTICFQSFKLKEMSMNFRKFAVGIAPLFGALCAAFYSPVTVQAQTWTHPGVVVSQSQLDATRAAYQSGNAVINDQVNKAKNSNYGSLTYTAQGPWPGGINQCGSNSNPNNGDHRPRLLSNNTLGNNLRARSIRSDITRLKQHLKGHHIAF